MKRAYFLFRKELTSIFVSPVAWIIMVLFTLVMGANLYLSMIAVSGDLKQLVAAGYGGLVSWFMLLVIPPLITMKSLADENRQGALEVLMVTGISDASVVAAKWAAAWIFYVILWCCLLPLWGILGMVGVLDTGVLFVTHMGLFVVGAAYCANGILASALTSHPLASAGLAFMFNVGLFMIHWLRFFFRPGDLELLWVEYLSAVHHIGDELTQGILDIRVIVWWGSFTLLTLFLSARVLERRRW